MISREILSDILRYGVMAPSGDNCQPWRFVIESNTLKIFNIPERDQSLYSFGQRASYFAHGALIENIFIAAQALGYQTNVDLFPDFKDRNFVAICRFEPTKPKQTILFNSIPQRASNRKPYRTTNLTPEQRQVIKELGRTEPSAELAFTEDPEKRNSIAYAAATNEEMLFGTKKMHHFFFDHINWTKDEDDRKNTGFYIDTLELPGPAKPLFRVLKKWNRARFFAKIGLPSQIAKGNAKNVYVTGAANGAVFIHTEKPEDFVHAGRLMERIWLMVTSLNLRLQPLAGITFLMQGIAAGQTDGFTSYQVARIKESYATMKAAYGLRDDDILVMAFRIGEGDEPSARASRLPPDIQFK